MMHEAYSAQERDELLAICHKWQERFMRIREALDVGDDPQAAYDEAQAALDEVPANYRL